MIIKNANRMLTKESDAVKENIIKIVKTCKQFIHKQVV